MARTRLLSMVHARSVPARRGGPRRWAAWLCLVMATAGLSAPGAVADPDEGQTASVQSDGAPAEAWSYDPDAPLAEGDITARMADEGIDRDEAVRRFRIEGAASLIEPRATIRWPTSFAGVWIEDDPVVIKVAFTSNAEAKVDELRADFPFPEALAAKTAPVSLRVLTTTQELMIADRNALQSGVSLPQLPRSIRDTEGRYDLGIDIEGSQIVVGVEEASDELREAFRTTYTSHLKLVEGLSGPSACNTEDCRYAMMSGLRLNIYDSNDFFRGACSSAFMTFSKVDFNVRYVLSAGHCSVETNNSYQRRHGGERYGAVNNVKYGGKTDVERVKRTYTPWKDSSKTIVAGELPRMVDDYITWADIVVNQKIGKTGIRTGTTRGKVKDKYFTPWWIPNATNRFVRASYCGAQGDSGAGVWQHNTAWGIDSSSVSGYGACDNAADFPFTTYQSVFGAMDFALGALNVGLLKDRNINPVASVTSSCDASDCTFFGGSSYDWDGKIVSYAWNFGDGTTGSGKTVTKVYPTSGTRTVTLTVTDNNGESGTKSKTVVIPTVKPPTLEEASADLVMCQVRLRWSPPSSGPTPDGYNLYRSTSSGGPYAFVKHVGALTMTTDTGLSPATTYHYVLKSTARALRSTNSNQRSATTGVCL